MDDGGKRLPRKMRDIVLRPGDRTLMAVIGIIGANLLEGRKAGAWGLLVGLAVGVVLSGLFHVGIAVCIHRLIIKHRLYEPQMPVGRLAMAWMVAALAFSLFVVTLFCSMWTTDKLTGIR